MARAFTRATNFGLPLQIGFGSIRKLLLQQKCSFTPAAFLWSVIYGAESGGELKIGCSAISGAWLLLGSQSHTCRTLPVPRLWMPSIHVNVNGFFYSYTSPDGSDRWVHQTRKLALKSIATPVCTTEYRFTSAIEIEEEILAVIHAPSLQKSLNHIFPG